MASRRVIRDAVRRLQRNWKTGNWLSGDNSYREDVIREIDRNKASGQNFPHLSEYIAASAVVHCFDGWSYLGLALEAEMAGNPDAARHLGYYAELRAAMSLMASEGIGVFRNAHFVLTEEETCKRIHSGGTAHEFVWDALEAWARLPKSADTVLRIIKPSESVLGEWLDRSSSGVRFITSKWLRQWGLDLSRLAQDRIARNLVSYRPTAFTSSGPRQIGEIMDSVSQFWRICDPEAGGGFPVLDRHLLRISLGLVFEEKHAQSPKQETAKPIYEKQIQGILGDLPLSIWSKDRWMKFLSYETDGNPPEIVKDAAGEEEASHIYHSKQVLARATLLLRVATGSVADILTEVEPDVRSKMNFWLHSASVRRRLWDKASPPTSFQDLWSDVEDAAEAVRKWMNDGGQSRCHYDFWAANAAEASVLSTAERVFLWGARL